MRRILQKLLPRTIREPLSAWRRRRARRARTRRARSTGAVDRGTLAADLRSAGVAPGDVLLVHSSLSGLGFVEGGAEAVVGALLDALGPEGTLLVPIFPMDRAARDWLTLDPLYDPRETPSRLGAVSELVRRRADARHADHPTHPFAGLGRRAEEMLSGHGHSPSPFGPESTFARLAERGGRILALGSPFAHVSAYHLVEEVLGERFPEPVFLPGTVDARVRGADGSIEVRPVRVLDPVVAERRLEVRPAHCERVRQALLARGAVTVHRIGPSESHFFDAATLERALEALALDEGLTIYDPAPAGTAAGRPARGTRTD